MVTIPSVNGDDVTTPIPSIDDMAINDNNDNTINVIDMATNNDNDLPSPSGMVTM